MTLHSLGHQLPLHFEHVHVSASPNPRLGRQILTNAKKPVSDLKAIIHRVVSPQNGKERHCEPFSQGIDLNVRVEDLRRLV